jgi:2-keto-4-pentenoate hydratase/2-oxohepta-3-ene-1,7-dioic acid hydratase in catechol pathway
MATWCRFSKDGQASYGVVEGDSVIAVDGSPFSAHKRTVRAYPLKDVKLLIPVVPPTFYCVGINYAHHIRKTAQKRGTEPVFPKKPDIGYRANTALAAHEEDIVKPKDAGEA